MTKAAVPTEMPPLPEGATQWRRSNRRGSMYHAHSVGFPVCGARLYLDRHKSDIPRDLGDMQYWGVCPRCFAKAKRQQEKTDA